MQLSGLEFHSQLAELDSIAGAQLDLRRRIAVDESAVGGAEVAQQKAAVEIADAEMVSRLLTDLVNAGYTKVADVEAMLERTKQAYAKYEVGERRERLPYERAIDF